MIKNTFAFFRSLDLRKFFLSEKAIYELVNILLTISYSEFNFKAFCFLIVSYNVPTVTGEIRLKLCCPTSMPNKIIKIK